MTTSWFPVTTFSRNIEFVEADAKGRSLHGLRKSILRSLNNFDGGLFAHFIG